MDRVVTYIITLYVTIVVVSSLLFPPMNIISIDNWLLPFVLLAITFFYFKNRTFRISLLLVVLIMGSCIISNYINNGLAFDEVLWSVRWLKLFIIGWASYYLITKNRKYTESLILMVFIGLTFINALQLIGVDAIVELYASKAEISDLLTRSLIDGRLSGTFINPNNNGFVFALFGVYFLVSGERAKYILLSISGILIVLSQSRTAFLAFLVVLVLVGLWLLSKHSRRRALYFLGGMCLFLMVAIQLNLKNLNSIFDGSAFRSNSITTRFEVIQKTIEVNEQNIWLGHGKINNIPDFLGYSIDNEYAYLYLEYGAIGIFFFLLLIGFLGILSMVQNKGHPVSIGLLLIMLVCGLTNLSFTNMEVGPVFALLFACALRLPGAENTNAIQNQSKA